MTTLTATTYHAHVYFAAEQTAIAEALRAAAREALGGLATVFPLVPRPVGPHLAPMFELNFDPAAREAVVAWLTAHHGALSVLVHAVTGYDHADHTAHAIWLGQPLGLDMSKLDPDPILSPAA
jgi:DOPA 4,5-dioxygenase